MSQITAIATPEEPSRRPVAAEPPVTWSKPFASDALHRFAILPSGLKQRVRQMSWDIHRNRALPDGQCWAQAMRELSL